MNTAQSNLLKHCTEVYLFRASFKTTPSKSFRRCCECKFSSSSPSFSTFSKTFSAFAPSSDDSRHFGDYLPSRPRRSSRQQNRSPAEHSVQDSRFVLISKLPSTVTPHDIRSLASRSAAVSRDITHIRILYTEYLHASGKAIVTFNTSAYARIFAVESRNRMIGGHEISMEQIFDSKARSLLKPPSDAPSIRLAKALIPSHSGRLVRVRGLPSTVTVERMYRMLERYGLADESRRWMEPANLNLGLPAPNKNIPFGDAKPASVDKLPAIIQLEPSHHLSVSTSFLIRLTSPFSAFRLVSMWNSTYWDLDRTLATFKGRRDRDKLMNEPTHIGIQSWRTGTSGDQSQGDIHDAEGESELNSDDPDIGLDSERSGNLGDRARKRLTQEQEDLLEELHSHLGSGVSQDGGGRLHVISANVLY